MRKLLLTLGLSAAACGEPPSGLVRLDLRGELRPSVLRFSEVEIGRAAVRTVDLHNTGAIRLAISALDVPPEFAVRGAAELTRSSIDSGDSLRLAVAFSPLSEGLRSAILTVTADELTVGLELEGAGVWRNDASLTLDPEEIDFGVVRVGDWVRVPFGVQNAGAGEGIVDAVRTESSDFLWKKWSVRSFRCLGATMTAMPQ